MELTIEFTEKGDSLLSRDLERLLEMSTFENVANKNVLENKELRTVNGVIHYCTGAESGQKQ